MRCKFYNVISNLFFNLTIIFFFFFNATATTKIYTLSLHDALPISDATAANRPIKLFYSYSHEDEAFREKLERHLAILRRQGVVKEWHDRHISAGREWKDQISEHLKTADVILLLVSSSFLNSD